MSDRLEHELLALLGEDAFVAFCEAFGGQRLYVPHHLAADHEIARVVGEKAALRFTARYCPAQIRVPLAHAYRARHYRSRRGWSNAQIARQFRMTETGVDKIFSRMDVKPAKTVADSRQLPLFSDNR